MSNSEGTVKKHIIDQNLVEQQWNIFRCYDVSIARKVEIKMMQAMVFPFDTLWTRKLDFEEGLLIFLNFGIGEDA